MGCSDTGCIFGHEGRGTNAGCRCLDSMRSKETRRRVRGAIVGQRRSIARLEKEAEELRASLRALVDAVDVEVLGDTDLADEGTDVFAAFRRSVDLLATEPEGEAG